uniref:Uncharacterized protein n=1 Tax=Pristionchus pacificus TaxID=54126 RepID=A0A2A6C3V6_PRIPA|eukprot:PDM72810.1 hypothetical protein PRIPAC_39244 [Pristionchus pacificus]
MIVPSLTLFLSFHSLVYHNDCDAFGAKSTEKKDHLKRREKKREDGGEKTKKKRVGTRSNRL